VALLLFVVGCHRYSKSACLFLAKVLVKVKVIFFFGKCFGQPTKYLRFNNRFAKSKVVFCSADNLAQIKSIFFFASVSSVVFFLVVAKVKISCNNLVSFMVVVLVINQRVLHKACQQSVHLTGGILRHFRAFFYTRTESCSWSFAYARPPASNANRWAFRCKEKPARNLQ
jgi:hypothetical protein